MAGLYENWMDAETGELVESCTIITRPAYKELGHIHDRMPVILPEGYFEDWLDCQVDNFPTVVVHELEFYPISNNVGSTNNDYKFEKLTKS